MHYSGRTQIQKTMGSYSAGLCHVSRSRMLSRLQEKVKDSATKGSLDPRDTTTCPNLENLQTSQVPPLGSMFSPLTPPLSSPATPLSSLVAPSLLSRSTSTSFRTFVHQASTTTPVTSSPPSLLHLLSPPLHKATPLTTEVSATMSSTSLPLPSLPTSSSLPSTTIVSRGEEVHKSQEMETTLPLDLSVGIRVSPFVSLKPSFWAPPTFILPTPPLSLASPLTISQSTLDTSVAISASTPAFTPPTTTWPWQYQLRTSLFASKAFVALGFLDPVSTTKESTMASTTISSALSQSQVSPSPAPSSQAMRKQEWIQMQLAKVEVTLEFDKASSSLKKVTKRRIKTGEQVTILQTEENILSLIRKRKRGTKGASRDDMELVVDPMSIVRSANKMSKEAVKRMQMELSQPHDKIVVEEAKATGKQTHHRFHNSLRQIGEWEAKLATLGNVAHRNLLPNVPLLSLDEVLTCENLLAKTKQVLEDGDTPLVTLNSHLELSSQNIHSLFANVIFPQVVKSDNTVSTEAEFETTPVSGQYRRSRWPTVVGFSASTDEAPRRLSVIQIPPTKFPAFWSVVSAVPLTDGRRFLASHTLSLSSLLPSRILSIYRPTPTTSANTTLKLALSGGINHRHALIRLPLSTILSGMPHKAHKHYSTRPHLPWASPPIASLGGLSVISYLGNGLHNSVISSIPRRIGPTCTQPLALMVRSTLSSGWVFKTPQLQPSATSPLHSGKGERSTCMTFASYLNSPEWS
eukprot:Gb_27444 [translate_table: standard]